MLTPALLAAFGRLPSSPTTRIVIPTMHIVIPTMHIVIPAAHPPSSPKPTPRHPRPDRGSMPSVNQVQVLLRRPQHQLGGQSLVKGGQFALITYRQCEQIGVCYLPMAQNPLPVDHAGRQ